MPSSEADKPDASGGHKKFEADDPTGSGFASRRARHFVVVTKEAQGAPARIRHRYPMVIGQHEVGTWVDPTCPPPMVRQMLDRPAGDEGTFEPVARAA